MKDFLKSLGFKVLVTISLVLIGIMIYACSTGGIATIPATVAGVIVAPIQSEWTSVTQSIGSFFGNPAALKADNQKLQDEINQLREQLVDYQDMTLRYEQLVEFLELKEQNPDYRFAPGQVIAADPSDKYGNFTIGSGSLSDIAVGDPVITAAGLVGVVYETGPNWAKVRTILDPSTHVSAYVSRTMDGGVTSGKVTLAQDGKLRLEELGRDAKAAVGDYVVSFGEGGNYPSKLLIGEIVEIAPESDGLSMYAVLKPFANIGKITDVLVITDFNGKDAS